MVIDMSLTNYDAEIPLESEQYATDGPKFFAKLQRLGRLKGEEKKIKIKRFLNLRDVDSRIY